VTTARMFVIAVRMCVMRGTMAAAETGSRMCAIVARMYGIVVKMYVTAARTASSAVASGVARVRADAQLAALRPAAKRGLQGLWRGASKFA